MTEQPGPHSPSQFDLSRHTCWGDVIQAPPSLLIVVCCTKTHQSMGTAWVLPIPEVPGIREIQYMLSTSSSQLLIPPAQITHSLLTQKVHRQVLAQVHITRHGLWNSDCFWQYMTSPCVLSSPVIQDTVTLHPQATQPAFVTNPGPQCTYIELCTYIVSLFWTSLTVLCQYMACPVHRVPHLHLICILCHSLL